MTASHISDQLIRLEQELLRPGTRHSTARLRELLHPDFREIADDGSVRTLQSLVDILAAEPANDEVPVEEPQHYAVEQLDTNLAQVVYETRRRGGERIRRSSIWQLQADRWRMRFHQATPYLGG